MKFHSAAKLMGAKKSDSDQRKGEAAGVYQVNDSSYRFN